VTLVRPVVGSEIANAQEMLGGIVIELYQSVVIPSSRRYEEVLFFAVLTTISPNKHCDGTTVGNDEVD
jgi:hypothetical protein